MQVREVPYRAGHLTALLPRAESPYLGVDAASAIEKEFFSYSILDGERVIFCGGFHEHWYGRYEAWAILANDAKDKFLLLHRIVKKKIESMPFKRIEAVVNLKFKEGHRWMRILGFKEEAHRMRNYGPTGEDFALYARIN